MKITTQLFGLTMKRDHGVLEKFLWQRELEESNLIG
jgi:hypothetical protein